MTTQPLEITAARDITEGDRPGFRLTNVIGNLMITTWRDDFSISEDPDSRDYSTLFIDLSKGENDPLRTIKCIQHPNFAKAVEYHYMQLRYVTDLARGSE